MDHVKQCRPDVFFTTVSYPIKGTPYFEKVASRLVSIGTWETSTDREIRVRGRHSENFYRHADELLKTEMAAAPDPERFWLHVRGCALPSTRWRRDRRVRLDPSEYDRVWTRSPVGRLQREAVWRHIGTVFQLGTPSSTSAAEPGEDALRLMQAGLRVRAIDGSGEMVSIARRSRSECPYSSDRNCGVWTKLPCRSLQLRSFQLRGRHRVSSPAARSPGPSRRAIW